jgi:acyl-CoA thioester hydrolase
VNNAVYLHYVEEAAIEHARQLGFDEARWRELGGAWVVRRHEIDYRVAAVAGDELDVTTRIIAMNRVSATRRTTMVRVADGGLVVQALTHWAWVGFDGRPRRLPAAAPAGRGHRGVTVAGTRGVNGHRPNLKSCRAFLHTRLT